jgi:ATP-binding cassette subfamily C (CFTR/MRP) protein 1
LTYFLGVGKLQSADSAYDAEFVGLSLSYGLSLNSVLFWAVWMSCFIENKMVSVERIKQFTNIASEAEWRIKDCLPVANWPTRGDIDVIDLKVNSSWCIL